MSRVVAREKALQLLYLFEIRKEDTAENIENVKDIMDNILKDIRGSAGCEADIESKSAQNEDASDNFEDADENNIFNDELYVETDEEMEDIIKRVLLQRRRNIESGKGCANALGNDKESIEYPILGAKKITNKDYEYITGVVLGVNKHSEELDTLISDNSKDWKLSRISIVDLSILRLALYEIKYLNDIPVGVSINESVNLAKKFSSKDSSAFINGILGAVVRK